MPIPFGITQIICIVPTELINQIAKLLGVIRP